MADRVGILTFHFVNNYGALLQAKSLQIYLDSLALQNEIVNVETFSRRKLYTLRGLTSWRNRARAISSIHLQLQKNVKFNEYRKSVLKCSKNITSEEELVSTLRNFSHIVVGSDQVWNPKYGLKAINTYTLTYPEILAKKISYAACIGSSAVSSEAMKASISSISEFAAISTRDEFSKRAIRELGYESPITKVLDPTFLVDWKIQKLTIKSNFSISTDYVFVYGFSREISQLVNALKNRASLKKIVAVGMEGEFYLTDGVAHRHNVGPREWIKLMREATYIITKSFHGFALALNLNKEVYVPLTDKHSVDRIVDLCNTLGIDKNYIDYIPCKLDSVKVLHISDYSRIRPAIDNKVSESKRFLIDSLT